jgi:uncharacterized protein (TIGR00288 family)
MPADVPTLHAALLIDWENLKSSLNDSVGALPDIVTLKKAVRRVGTLRVAKAYANWAEAWHDGDSHRLSQQGVDPVHVMTREVTGGRPVKNSADVRLACDGIEMLMTHPTLETFVLVSGDGDLVHLVDKLKAHGKRVIVIAAKQSLSSSLRVACDQVVHYDDLVSGLRPIGDNSEIQSALVAFSEALINLHDSQRDTSLTTVKAEMVQRMPAFNEEALGVPSFRHLAFLAEANGYCLVDARTEPFTALPPTAGDAPKNGLFAADLWQRLVNNVEPDHDYPHGELKAVIGASGVPPDKVGPLLEAAKRSNMISYRERKVMVHGKKDFRGSFRLNPHHPRVQVLRRVQIVRTSA